MPTATDELRQKMLILFGDPIDDRGPWKYLKDRGYTETGGYIHAPSPIHRATETENDCIDFLCQEWDYAYEWGTPV